jgi:hypothetical protein
MHKIEKQDLLTIERLARASDASVSDERIESDKILAEQIGEEAVVEAEMDGMVPLEEELKLLIKKYDYKTLEHRISKISGALLVDLEQVMEDMEKEDME